jgi:hypothetical protein
MLLDPSPHEWLGRLAMRHLGFAPLLVCLTLLLTSRAASADPVITMTKCEPTTWNGRPGQLITFSVNPGTSPVIMITMKAIAQPAPSDSCPILAVISKPAWDGGFQADGSAVWQYNFMPTYPGFWDGFQVILAGDRCCNQFQLWAFGHPDLVATEADCFTCAPVPTRPTTWGMVKGLYR